MDLMMTSYPVPDNEAERVKALRALDLIGSPREKEYDSVVALACDLFQVPIAAVALVDEHRQWLKAARGVDVCSTERESAFCNYPVTSGAVTIVEDASQDERFNSNRLVTDSPFIRFYAGVPLSIEPGLYLGTLCIMDTKSRTLRDAEVRQLTQLADIVTALIRQHRDGQALIAMTDAVTEQDRLLQARTEALARSKDLFDRASELTHMGAWEWMTDTGELSWSDGMYDIHEMPRGSEVTPDQIHGLYPETARADMQKLMADHTSGGKPYVFEGPMLTAKGHQRWIRLTGDVERENGKVVRRFGVKQDITSQKALWDRMQFLAECDPLTGLANRNIFEKRLRRAEKSRHRTEDSLALLLVDVDGFKHINDAFGHAVGDECLRQIARRLRRVKRGAEMVARLGGDEFAVLINATAHGTSPAECAEFILNELRRPIRWDGQSFQLSGSIGVAVLDRGAQHHAQLFTEADLALYAAKAAGRNTFRVFDPAMKAAANARYETVRVITKALRANQLELYYQPKIDLGTNSLSGFEALLRWRRPDGEVVAAGAFSAALEDPELSDRIGDWVIEEALYQAREWQAEGYKFGHIAINLSSGQFRQSSFADRLIQQVVAHGLEPRMIEVEVTEGVFLSQEAGPVKKILETLRSAGIRIALDDFGTGFASLSHLRTYPVDVIKIDRSFVRHFLTSFQDHAILQSTLFLARHLRLDVVAEGIEQAEQSEFLKALGCRFGQGYLFSKAVPSEEAASWCRPLTSKKAARQGAKQFRLGAG